MQAHDIARCIVQDQGEAVERHDLMEPAVQLVEQRGQIAVQDDRFRYRQQGSVQVRRVGCLCRKGRACHGEHLNHDQPKTNM